MASRFLLDENLSPRLASALCDLQLKGKSGQKNWDFTSDNGYTIVSKDDDFCGLSLLLGAPPKVIWIDGTVEKFSRIAATVTATGLTAWRFLQAASG